MSKVGWGKRLTEIRGKIERGVWAATFGNGIATWANYEAEKTAPGLDTLIILKERHGVDLNWLATGDRAAAGVDFDVLGQVIQAVHEEVPKIDAESKAKLILRLYKDRILLLQQEREATPSKKGRAAS